jgi:hypothetical protein
LKYTVKNNVFALGKLHKAGTVIEIEPEEELFFKGAIEKVSVRKKTVKKSEKDGE